MSTVSFETTSEESDVVTAIVDRAAKMADQQGHALDRMSCRMDITATHANGNPLNLSALLGADDFNFAHDVFGIAKHIDRATGKLEHCFRPRFSA